MNRLRNAAAALLLTGLGLSSVSCDKAKLAVTAAREKFRGADPSAPVLPGGEVDPDLGSQVDSAAEGVRFRRDLPFPTEVSVRTVERLTFQEARIVNTSAIGTEKAPLTGKHETISNIQRSGSQLTVQIEKSGRVVEKEASEEDGKEKVIPVADAASVRDDAAKRLEGASIEFRQTTNGWRLPDSKGPVDFNRMLWGKQLQTALPPVLASEGILPRTQWFSSTRRWNTGDKFEISGDSLGLLFPGKSSGKVNLTYEVTEALEGHPCGRFAVTGDVSVKDATGVEGITADQEISIRSGKVWCSLLYPLVLREDLDTVQTITSGSGGAKMRIQGGVLVLRTRQWK
jgi:hypothetical protein